MIKQKNQNELLKDLLTIVSITVVALLLIVLFKVKGGILGIVLGTLAVIVLIYWLMEIKKIFRDKKSSPEEFELFYDVVEEKENVAVVAKVPGPAREVKVRIVDDMIEIKGGGDFIRRLQTPKGAQLQETSYINGVLFIKLQKQVHVSMDENQ